MSPADLSRREPTPASETEATPEPVDLARLEALAEKATPGPWEGVTDDHGRHGLNFSIWAGDTDGCYIAEQVMTGAADAEFIAALRNAAPSLVAAVRAVERVRALHHPYDCTAAGERDHEDCVEREWCYTCPEELGWPCPTVAALDGAS